MANRKYIVRVTRRFFREDDRIRYIYPTGMVDEYGREYTDSATLSEVKHYRLGWDSITDARTLARDLDNDTYVTSYNEIGRPVYRVYSYSI